MATKQLEAAKPIHTRAWFLFEVVSIWNVSTKTVRAGNMFKLTATNKAIIIIDLPKLMMSVVMEAIQTEAIGNLIECSLKSK
jgi:hypothetical protein